jgi:hypothetical protein
MTIAGAHLVNVALTRWYHCNAFGFAYGEKVVGSELRLRRVSGEQVVPPAAAP